MPSSISEQLVESSWPSSSHCQYNSRPHPLDIDMVEHAYFYGTLDQGRVKAQGRQEGASELSCVVTPELGDSRT